MRQGRRMGSIRFFWWTLLIVAAVATFSPKPAAAQSCFTIPGCPEASSGAPLTRIGQLCGATAFANNPRTDFFQPGFLPLNDATGKYTEADVDSVIAWAKAAAPQTCATRGILLEASFRKASARAYFGDEMVLRGLNAVFDPANIGASDPLVEGLTRLDSRKCRNTTTQNFNPTSICTLDSECATTEVCDASRLSTTETIFGATQEYRRAEQALIDAIRFIGVELYQYLDATQLGCGGGCGTRLLLHIGAMKTRAQAERVDQLWSRAVAAVGSRTDVLTCSIGPVGQPCRIDRDCESSSTRGRCGAEAADRALIALRQAAHEALAEASVAQTIYQQVLPADLSSADDFAMLYQGISRITQASTRSIVDDTPFGLPANYTPVLTTIQQAALDCWALCPPGQTCSPSAASSTQCLLNLARSADIRNILAQAEEEQAGASTTAQDYVDALQDTDQYTIDMRDEFRRTLNRLFGTPCQGCTCTLAEQAAGRCISVPDLNATWLIEGAHCDGDDPQSQFACADGADGEFERQLHAIRTAQVNLGQAEDEIERNAATLEKTAQVYARLQGIETEACGATQLAIQQAGNALGAALGDAIGSKEKQRETQNIVAGSVATVAVAVCAFVTAGACSAAAPLAIGAATGILFGPEDAKEALQLQRQLAIVQLQKELQINAIQCLKSRSVLAVQEDKALWDVETEGQRLLHQAVRFQAEVVDAVIALNALGAELEEGARLYGQSKFLQGIWADQEFRNPQNYRAVALQKQLRATSKFRLAQLVTWLILRASSYDLARADAADPETLAHYGAGGTVTFPDLGSTVRVDECRRARCSGPGEQTVSCITDGDCGGDCSLAATDSPVADRNGSCSLRAVFAAHNVDQLRDLVASAYLDQVVTSRVLACGQNGCSKVIQLSRILTDYDTPPPTGQFPPLGPVLADSPLTSGSSALSALVDFGISLGRDFDVCAQLPDGSQRCAPLGTAGLGNDGSGPGVNSAPDIWNARFLNLRGVVRYRSGQDPTSLKCRLVATGTPIGSCGTVPEGGQCTGTGGKVGRCNRIFDAGLSGIETTLVQLAPGIVRSSIACRTDDPATCQPDALLNFTIRRGNLPSLAADCTPANPCAIPGLGFFRVPLTLASSLEQSNPVADIKGVPVASQHWQLRISSNGLQVGAGDPKFETYFREFLRSIADIELAIQYQGFDL